MVLSDTTRPRKPPKPLGLHTAKGMCPCAAQYSIPEHCSPPAHPALPGITIFSLFSFPVLRKICLCGLLQFPAGANRGRTQALDLAMLVGVFAYNEYILINE